MHLDEAFNKFNVPRRNSTSSSLLFLLDFFVKCDDDLKARPTNDLQIHTDFVNPEELELTFKRTQFDHWDNI